MNCRVIVLVCFLFSISLETKCQENLSEDSLRAICYGPVFSLCEEMPHLKYGIRNYQDTIQKMLNRLDSVPANGEVSLRLLILMSGEVAKYEIETGQSDLATTIIELLRSMKNQWNPGKQNGRIICCYKKIRFISNEGHISVLCPERP